jgi:murein DD-endopeptidase MepM/ murein hydrolase activator NlpD
MKCLKNKHLRRCIALLLAASIAFHMSQEAMATGTSGKASSSSASTELKEAENEKASLEKELANVQQTIKDLKSSQGSVESKVAELNQQLVQISASITELENQLTQKSQDIEAAKQELDTAKQEEAKQYEDMKVRIQFMYENGQTSYLDALLSARNLSDFLNAAEYIKQIESYDRQKLAEYQDTVTLVADMEAQLEQDYSDLETMKADVEQDKAYVASVMKQKETELAGIADDIEDAQSEADYYAAEIQAQEELIAAIKRAEAEKAAAGIVDNPYSGGAFTWPCPSSTRVTSDYGNRTSPTSGASSNHKGIDIGADYGADIVAAAGGTVKAANYSSAAGNYIMIDHGGGLYTVYMHASSLVVSEGQTVSAGQVIAKVGSTGISTGNHLHFGVSLNGSYVSPWSYLGG